VRTRASVESDGSWRAINIDANCKKRIVEIKPTTITNLLWYSQRLRLPVVRCGNLVSPGSWGKILWTRATERDMKDLDCDFSRFLGPQKSGPTGVGVLWVRPEILERMDPVMSGGEMISKVTLELNYLGGTPF